MNGAMNFNQPRNYLVPHRQVLYPPMHNFRPPLLSTPALTRHQYNVPSPYNLHNQYYGYYYNHHGDPVEVYSQHYQYNGPISQVACQRSCYHCLYAPELHSKSFYHLTPLRPVELPLETVIKPASEVEEREPTLCELLTRAEAEACQQQTKQETEQIEVIFSSEEMPNATLIDGMSYMSVVDDNNLILPADIPDPQVTFIYEQPANEPEESAKIEEIQEQAEIKEEPHAAVEETRKKVDDNTNQKADEKRVSALPNTLPVCSEPRPKRIIKRKSLAFPSECEDWKKPKVVNSTDPELPTKLECALCKKTFNGHAYFMQHYKTRHSGEQQFKCKKCGKKFFDDASLQSHLQNHVTKDFKCSQCSRLFAHKYDLSRHMKTHLTRLPHECEFCTKGFVRRDHMKQHELRCKKSPTFKKQRKQKTAERKGRVTKILKRIMKTNKMGKKIAAKKN